MPNGGSSGYQAGSSQSAGMSASSAIDITSRPSPPPAQPTYSDKKPICIGAIHSRAIMLYPSQAAIVGSSPPPGSREKFHLVNYLGAELLKVKLKLRIPGQDPRPSDIWPPVSYPTLQIMTPGMSSYIGDLDPHLAEQLIPLVSRGLLRLEGFIQRVFADGHLFQIRINVLLFTLSSNITFIANSLIANNIYLLDPIPPYDPARHNEQPEYHNAHGGGDHAMQLMIAAQRKTMPGFEMTLGQLDKTKQVEVQRRQVDEVFKSLETGGTEGELEECDPGPFIKTSLYPHQRKALTFLLQREQDWSALKRARKYFAKVQAKRSKKNKDAIIDEDEEEQKGKVKDRNRSLWESKSEDSKGRVLVWKNRVTGQELRTKKGERPKEGKGAILADDMGLGKTLSVVSLISSTRHSAAKWARSKLESVEEPAASPPKDGLSSSVMRTKVFGMPENSDDDSRPIADFKGKKRKRDEPASSECGTTRRSRLVRRSKATLLVCPMSTITNWEEQIRDHWNGKVEIIGGAAGTMPPKEVTKKWKPPKRDGESSDEDEDFDTLKVYIYHGASRRADPDFIGDFDIVVTSYNTLALEYTRQRSGDATPASPSDTAPNSDDDLPKGDTSLNGRPTKPEVEAEIKAAEVADALLRKKRKGKGTAKATFETSPLQAIDWFRVVLDEAHYIKSDKTIASQASCDLQADRRIALTGTPIQNKIEDVQALFKFLRLSPVDEKEVFNKYIAGPCKFGEQIGVARLQLVMRCCTLRRTKDSTTDGKKILNLPSRKEIQLWLDLSEEERRAYDDRASKAKEKLEDLKAKNLLSKNIGNVLQDVLRLRQICDHVDLAMQGAVEEDYDGTIMDYEVACKGIKQHGLSQTRAVAVVCFLKNGDGASCTSCGHDYGDYFPSIELLEMEEDQKEKQRKKMPVKLLLTKCLHLFCPSCFKEGVYPDWSARMKEHAGRPCTCGNILRLPSDVVEVLQPGVEENAGAADQGPKRARKKYIRAPGEPLVLSTKMKFLHDELMSFSRRNPNSPHYNPFELDADTMEEVDKDGKPFVTKSVIFSQWTTMLDRIGDMLDEIDIKYARLDGTMSREDRAKAIEDLKHKKRVEVLLVSTRAGGVGLNLTAASRCYLVDPYWNPSVESQAIDRIHRMGQTRPVTAIKLMINDSIEQRLDKIQRKKAQLADVSLNNLSRKELMEKRVSRLTTRSFMLTFHRRRSFPSCSVKMTYGYIFIITHVACRCIIIAWI
ncbi:SNF2 family N-terminal domain-domain-containing protein [Kockovaella imperatae]|uniref:SNF2 family N-terminal domain-domain-containing protein n=1 Tax=Kockovaella imperatae TaxID=4999 RepID=A0A1Y1U7L6_9TREE|nr:SNF2 family N-terminal domain-domain-containing protein [Kockovaella imperatae]ORX34003.1 SNF2 family N-terminal domain-domain-containing protein [Kockovaella imperatae]